MNDKKKKSSKRKKQQIIPVRVTPEEKELIQKFAEECSLKPSTYLRELGLKKKVKSNIDSKFFYAMLEARADLGRLGGLFKAWLSPTVDLGSHAEGVALKETNKGNISNTLNNIDSLIEKIEKIVTESVK